MKIGWKSIYTIVISASIWAAMTSKRGGEELLTSKPLLDVGNIKNIFPAAMLAFFIIVFFDKINRNKFSRDERILMIAIYFMTFGAVMGGVLGESFYFDPRLFVFPSVMTLLVILIPNNIAGVVDFGKSVCLFYAYGSLVSLIILPDWAAEWSYSSGVIEGLKIRLHGLSGHANNLSSFMVMFFILNTYRPQSWSNASRFNLSNLINSMTAIIILYFCQSKTNWIVLICSLLFYKYAHVIINKNYKTKVAINIMICIFLLIVVLVAYENKSLIEKIFVGTFSESQIERASSLTGRFEIWTVVINGWVEHPIFGYGSGIFTNNSLYANTLGFTPSHAHGQIFQSIGEAGSFGLLGVVFYWIILILFANKLDKDCRPLIYTLLFFFFIRSVTQSVFRSGFDDPFIMHMLLVSILMSGLKQKSLCYCKKRYSENSFFVPC